MNRYKKNTDAAQQGAIKMAIWGAIASLPFEPTVKNLLAALLDIAREVARNIDNAAD